MKILTILSLFLLASPAFSQLTKEDLRTIIKEEVRAIIKEEVRPIIKEEIAASEKRTREYIDLKIETVNTRIDGLDKSFNRAWILILALIGLITAAIAIPQMIIAFREKGHKEMQVQIDQLNEKLEAMQSSPQRET